MLLLASFSLFSQEDDTTDYVHDPMAKKYLDQLSEKLEKYNTARFYFKYTLLNGRDSTQDSLYGYLFVMQPDKYKVIVPEQEIFSDGVKTYAYNKKANEMTITFVDPNSDAVYTPSKLLSLYKHGFKYSYRGVATFPAEVKTDDGKIKTMEKACHVIDLYPEKPKGKPYSIIRIWIDKNTNDLVSVKYQMKNGIDQVVDILQTTYEVKLNEKMFTFNKEMYPKDIDITDFTED